MPGNDNPSLGGYELDLPPDQLNMRWFNINQVNNLADGGVRFRSLGYQFQAELVWDSNWIRLQDWTGLMAVVNDSTGQAGTGVGGLTFTPRPNTYPARSFVVHWVNKFDFSPRNFWTYGGEIQLVGVTPTASVSEIM